jgi:hypothetical protein
LQTANFSLRCHRPVNPDYCECCIHQQEYNYNFSVSKSLLTEISLIQSELPKELYWIAVRAIPDHLQLIPSRLHPRNDSVFQWAVCWGAECRFDSQISARDVIEDTRKN